MTNTPIAATEGGLLEQSRWLIFDHISKLHRTDGAKARKLDAALDKLWVAATRTPAGHADGWRGNQMRRDVQHVDAAKGWEQARAALSSMRPVQEEADYGVRLDYERRILDAEIEGVKAEKAMREAAARASTSFLVGDPANGVPLRNPMAHEIADAIRKLPLTLGSNDPAPSPVQEEGVGPMRQALDLARNRLRAAAVNEAAKGGTHYHEYSQWADEADAALASHPEASPPSLGVEELREALIECGRAVGCLLTDQVSNEFLMLVPAEIKAKIEALSRVSGGV